MRVCICPKCGESIVIPKAPLAGGEKQRGNGPAFPSGSGTKTATKAETWGEMPPKSVPPPDLMLTWVVALAATAGVVVAAFISGVHSLALGAILLVGLAGVRTVMVRLANGARQGASGKAGAYPWHVKIVGAMAAALVIGLPLYFFWPRDTWERDNYSSILDLCAKADLLASHGKTAEAQQKYEEVVTAIGDRQLVDKKLRQAVAKTACVQGETKATPLLRSGDWAGAEREFNRLLDFLNASPADDPDTNAARRRATRGAREARTRILEAEAARVAQGGNHQKTIAQYNELLDYLQKQPPDDPVVAEARRKATEVKQNVEAALARIRAEEERRRLEEEQRRLAEQRRREEEAQRALVEARKRTVREQFFRSPAYAQMKSQADSLIQALELDLTLEDSAWRAISTSSETAARLMAILVRMEAAMTGQDVSADVIRVLTELDTDMLGETSALRAVFKKDRAFLQLLGVWCKVLEKGHPGLCASFIQARQDLSLAMITEDSAYRAQSAHLRTCIIVLQDILAAHGFKTEADKIASEARLANIADTSAIRSAMNNAEACMDLILLLAEQRDKTKAAGLHRDVMLKTVGDDSAVRAHSAYKKTLARGLHILITSPGSP